MARVVQRYRYADVADYIADAIIRGAYADGDRLPSIRDLMISEAISQATAMRAMVELETRGLAFSRYRSGFFARQPKWPGPGTKRSTVEVPPPTESSSQPYTVEVFSLTQKLFEAFRTPGLVALGAAEIDYNLLPTAELSAATQRAIRAHGSAVFSTQDPQGLLALRQTVARLLTRRGMTISAQDVVITAGETDAMSLALRAVTRPGDTVAVESPTFFGILQEIQMAGLKAVEIATDPANGVDADDLIATADQIGIQAVILNPTFENPFGCTMPNYARRLVAEAMAQRGIPIIEDDVYGDLGFNNQQPRSLASFDIAGNTIYCASYSKVLSPGMRVGWCVPGRHWDRVAAIQDRRPVSSLAQYTLADYLKGRRLNRHVAGLRSLFEQQGPLLRRLIGGCFPAGTTVTAPEGGYLYWIEVPPPFDAMSFYRTALATGISIAPGPVFSASGRFEHALRISVGRKLTPSVQRAIETLGRLASGQGGGK